MALITAVGRKTSLILILHLFFFYGRSQDTLVTYFDGNWQLTTQDSAHYYRKAFKMEKDKYNVRDYFMSGKLQMTGIYTSDKFDIREGKFTYYFENGNKEAEGYYTDDVRTGSWSNWYENGQPYADRDVDTLWGRAVEDPYRWLESIDSKETQDWLKIQKRIKEKHKGEIINLTECLNYYSYIQFKPLFKEGAYFFSYYWDGQDETASLYYRKNEGDARKLLFDPNRLSRSEIVGIDDIKISSDNATLALILERNGGDWKEIRFLDMASKKLLSDTIGFVKYSQVYWHNQGVFYVKYTVRSTHQSMVTTINDPGLYYHKIGTEQSQDVLVFKHEDKYGFFDFEVTPEGKYLVLQYSEANLNGSFHKISLIPLNNNNPHFEKKEFISTSNLKSEFIFLGELNGKLLVKSNLNAPSGAIYQADPKLYNTLIPFIPSYDEQLQFAKVLGRKIVSVYNNGMQSSIMIKDSLGQTVALWTIPQGYRVSHFTGALNDSIAIYSFSSFFNPPSNYKVNLNTFKIEPLSITEVLFNNKDIVTETVYYYSKDSTKVPMYLTYKRGLKLNGKNPTILYGYGGFGISMEPFFNVANILFFRNGGILATPGIRGGGEYPGWHEKGQGLNKQNTFDDFIAAAEYLILKKYTNSNKLAAMGGSHGGLLVGATMLQRPELFKVVVSTSGVFDMIRSSYFNIGYLYEDEFGSINDSLSFVNLMRYSPVHNVKKGINYPATLLVASDNDDRVNPFHSFKFISELQAKGSGKTPYVLYYQEKSGHYGSDIFEKRLQTDVYIYAFIFKNLGITYSINCNN